MLIDCIIAPNMWLHYNHTVIPKESQDNDEVEEKIKSCEQGEAIKANTQEEKKIEETLYTLRNTSLAALFVVNLLWILLLNTIEFVEIHAYIKPFRVKTFELVFLSLYALLLFIQFAAMIIHRITTLVHYIGTFSKSTEDKEKCERTCKAACGGCVDTSEWFLNKPW